MQESISCTHYITKIMQSCKRNLSVVKIFEELTAWMWNENNLLFCGMELIYAFIYNSDMRDFDSEMLAALTKSSRKCVVSLWIIHIGSQNTV
jgi:hypothetical protein